MESNRRVLGVFLVVFFVVVSEVFVCFDEYVLSVLGLSRFWPLLLLWALPAIACYLSISTSKSTDYAWAFFLVFLVGFLGAVVHFLAGELGAKVDLSGVSGMKVVFEVYVGLGTVSVGLGYAVAKIDLLSTKA